MSNENTLSFLNGWKVELSKLPEYTHFTGNFTEKADWKLLKIIYESPFLETRPEIKNNVKILMEKTLRSSGEIKVLHTQAHKCGRFYADKSISLIPLSKYVKHTVMKYLGWLDIDMVKGHASIAIEIGKKVGKSFPVFENYVNNFDDIVCELSKFYSADTEKPLDKDNIKWLFNSMIYGGGFNNWIEGLKNGDETYEPRSIQNEDKKHHLISGFKTECQYIMNQIYKDNPALSKKVAGNKTDIYEKKCCVCSYWFQIIENHIVHNVAGYLIDKGILTEKTYGLEFDGLNIPPTNIEFDKDLLINDINLFVKSSTGLNITFKFKDYDDKNILYDLIEIRKNMVDNDGDDKQNIIDENITKYSKLYGSSEKISTTSSDYDLAKSIADMYGENYVCASINNNIWFEFKEHRWVQIECANTLHLLIPTKFRDFIKSEVDKVNKLMELLSSNEEDKLKRLSCICQRLCEVSARLGRTNDIKNIMTQLRHILYEPKFFEKLDTKNVLCCKNGVIDFTTKTFRAGLKTDYCSKSTGINYIENDADLIQQDYDDLVDFLEKIFPFEDQRIFMFQHLASVIIGDCKNQQMFHYYGYGSNGKSMITKLMAKMLGEYAGTIPTTLICQKRGKIGSCSPEVAGLKGLKDAVLQEPTKGDTINEGIMKELTGCDPISGRALYQDTVSFYPTFTVVSALNNFYNINTTDHGTWRRQQVIKFYSSFLDINGRDYDSNNELHFPLDKNVADQFDRFKEPFLQFLVQTAFQTNGDIEKCAMVDNDTMNYRYSQDRIGKFILENVIDDDKATITKSQINMCANTWFEENYKYKIPNKELYERLAEKYDCNKSGVYSGFTLKNCAFEPDVVELTKEEVFTNEFLKYFEITGDKKDFMPSISISEWAKVRNLKVNGAKTINPLLLPLGLDVNNKEHYKLKKIEGKPVQSWFGVKLREKPLENIITEPQGDTDEEEEEIHIYE